MLVGYRAELVESPGGGLQAVAEPKTWSPSWERLVQPPFPGLGAAAQEQRACPEAALFRGREASILWPLEEPRLCPRIPGMAGTQGA